MFDSRKLLCALLINFTPKLALACACGCGVFDVGTSSMLPNSSGGEVFMEYDFMNQNENWSGKSIAPAANNSDKQIRTSFVNLGGQYMFNRSWGIEAEVPYDFRHFRTTDDNNNIVSFNHSAFGDVRVQGIYSGFSPNMTTGVTFGLKLPTGDFTYANFDRDTELGTGSTDTLLGAYHVGTQKEGQRWNWFTQALWDHPVLTSAGYRPGDEIDGAAGLYYEMGDMHGWGNVTPLLQIIGSQRLSDSGVNANPSDSGYSRLYISPGIEANLGRVSAYADVEVPVYQYMNGNQLVAPFLVKFIMGYHFD